MATRKVKDAKDLETGDLIYFKSHAKATYMSSGKSIEDALNDGDFLTRDTADEAYLGVDGKAASAASADHAASADTAVSATSAVSAESATKASQDGEGNVISETYATKDGLSEGLAGKSDVIEVVESSSASVSQAISPNVFYVFGEVTSLSVTLADGEEGVYNEYMFQFTSGTTATTLTLPDSIMWVAEPSVEAGKIYQCSIVNNVGVIASVDNA